ncbi:MAG: hypothetical protein ACK2UO_20180 [Caldilineaceae bacterium]
MILLRLHDGLANTATIFVLFLGVWAFVLRFRSHPLNASWYGAAVVGEIVILVQAVIGLLMYAQGLGAALPRPFIHILYGVVAVITLPGAYAYIGNIEDEKLKTVMMALICIFLWGILRRAATVAEVLPVTG